MTIAWMARRERQLERAAVDRLYVHARADARRTPIGANLALSRHPPVWISELGSIAEGGGKEPHPN